VLLVINAGSSSLKFSAFASDNGAPRLQFRGQLEGIDGEPHLSAHDAAGNTLVERRWPGGTALTHAASFDVLREWLDAHLGGQRLAAVGHRVVHGGYRFAAPVRIDENVLRELEDLVPLAPLHQPHNLAIIRAIAAREPDLPQVACFDTAFHRTMPDIAQRFALPRKLHDDGIRRYGFHGLSYEYLARRLHDVDAAVASRRVIVAHLGAGASLCAMRDGRSVDTTMSFTALDGVPMGTRSGALDPGVLLYLLEQRQMTPAQLSQLLYHESGLLGVSGIASDMRALEASADARAREAIDLFVYRIAREIGALAAVLGGLDALVFTAGIGENSAEVRRRVCERAAWLNLRLDASDNAAHATVISPADSAVKVLVLPTDEEKMIAVHTLHVLTSQGARFH
jgi:acetate kinase